jgi:hypothetical protein
LPDGWKPLLIDPLTNKGLTDAINSNFFIGAFVQLQPNAPNSGQIVLLIDDTRYGPSPVRVSEFASVKNKFSKELDDAQFTCDEPDKVCAFMTNNVNLTYTELINVKGRVVNVTTINPGAQSQDKTLLKKSAQIFVEMLRLENTK